MVDVYSTEPERRAAVDELTALRRELKTETAAGAKTAKSDPRFIAAQARLDAAKSAGGMRTSAEDLAALNKIATRDISTADMTPAQKRAERQALNQPSRQYFKQVRETINDITRPPAFAPRIKAPDGSVTNKISQFIIDENKKYNWDYSEGRLVWALVGEPGKEKWGVGLMGGKKIAPTVNIVTQELARDQWMSDTETLGEVTQKYIPSITNNRGWGDSVKINQLTPGGSAVTLDELAEAIPEIKFTQFQEVIYQLTLEKDTDITIEDILDKYNEMYGEG